MSSRLRAGRAASESRRWRSTSLWPWRRARRGGAQRSGGPAARRWRVTRGIDEPPRGPPARRIRPLERYGLKVMSMGFFLDEQSPVIWRGPIVMGIVRQFLHDVDWAPLEFLVVDLPPGTGDAPLTLVQQVPVAGGGVGTTPQGVATLAGGRGIAMFRR